MRLGQCNAIRQTPLHKEEVFFREERECTQGGVLSPLVWALLINDLLTILSMYEAYADNLVIVIKKMSEKGISQLH